MIGSSDACKVDGLERRLVDESKGVREREEGERERVADLHLSAHVSDEAVRACERNDDLPITPTALGHLASSGPLILIRYAQVFEVRINHNNECLRASAWGIAS